MATTRQISPASRRTVVFRQPLVHETAQWQRNRRRRSFYVRVVVPAIRLVLLAGLIFAAWRLFPRHSAEMARQIENSESSPQPEVRTEYPLSLIPGGVRSDADLEAARASDPVLAEHYADVGFLRPAVFDRNQMLYASFRQGRSIVWTSAPILVHAGEAVFADRTGNLVRGRCGNRLSETARSPAAIVEPPEVASESPQISFPAEPVLPDTSFSSLDDSMTDLDASLPSFPSIEEPPSHPAPPSPPPGVPGGDLTESHWAASPFSMSFPVLPRIPNTLTSGPPWPSKPVNTGIPGLVPVSQTPISSPVVPGPVPTPEPATGLSVVLGLMVIAALASRLLS